VVPIHLPPLRDRREDIPLLLNHFLQKSNQRNGRNIKLTSELLDFLVDYRWPGNVREMQNLVERMVILAEGERLTLADLPVELVAPGGATNAGPSALPMFESVSIPAEKKGRRSLQDIERAEIELALRRHGWVQVRAARELGLTQRQMGYRIRKYNLSRFDAY